MREREAGCVEPPAAGVHPSPVAAPTSNRGLGLLLLAYLGFVGLGLPDGLLGVAWPSMRADFGLPLDALGPMLASFVAGYAFSSFVSGRLVAFMGIGSLLAASSVATGASLFCYAIARSWWLVVGFALVAGLGAGGIDAGINTWAALTHSPRTINWLHACYGAGAALGPVVMTRVLAEGRSWRAGYLEVAGAQALLAVAFFLARARFEGGDASSSEAVADEPLSATLGLPATWLSLGAFFVYTGLEMAAGVWTYTLFTEARGVDMETAGRFATLFWGGLGMGRLLVGFIPARVPARALLRSAIAAIAVAAVAVTLDRSAVLASVSLAALGLACGPVFPSLIAGTPARLGASHAANAVGMQITAAALGQSLLPSAIGFAAARFGVEIVGPVLVVAALSLFVIHEALSQRSRRPANRTQA